MPTRRFVSSKTTGGGINALGPSRSREIYLPLECCELVQKITSVRAAVSVANITGVLRMVVVRGAEPERWPHRRNQYLSGLVARISVFKSQG
jgi:hypothetical protein